MIICWFDFCDGRVINDFQFLMLFATKPFQPSFQTTWFYIASVTLLVWLELAHERVLKAEFTSFDMSFSVIDKE